MLLNTANLASMFILYQKEFKGAFDGAKTDWQKIAKMIPNKSAAGIYAWLGQFPKLREWLGDRHIKDMQTYEYTLTNKKFESTVAVEKTDIDDDIYAAYGSLFAEMGHSAALHPDELVFEKLLAGATDLCYDGQAFFDSSHPVIANGAATTVSNYDSSSVGGLWVVMDLSRPMKPIIWQKREDYNLQSFTKVTDESVFMTDQFRYGVRGRSVAGFGLWQLAYGSVNTLNATNFEAAVKAMMSFKSDEDKSLGIKATALLVGPGNWDAGRTIIEQQLLASGESNKNYKFIDLIVSTQMA